MGCDSAFSLVVNGSVLSIYAGAHNFVSVAKATVSGCDGGPQGLVGVMEKGEIQNAIKFIRFFFSRDIICNIICENNQY